MSVESIGAVRQELSPDIDTTEIDADLLDESFAQENLNMDKLVAKILGEMPENCRSCTYAGSEARERAWTLFLGNNRTTPAKIASIINLNAHGSSATFDNCKPKTLDQCISLE